MMRKWLFAMSAAITGVAVRVARILDSRERQLTRLCKRREGTRREHPVQYFTGFLVTVWQNRFGSLTPPIS